MDPTSQEIGGVFCFVEIQINYLKLIKRLTYQFKKLGNKLKIISLYIYHAK